MVWKQKQLNRRAFMAATAGMVVLSTPSILRASEREISVGTFGGLFKDAFDQHVYPEFTKATGIKVRSIALPNSPAWLVQIANAVRAGKVPADVSMMAGIPIPSGIRQGLFLPLDLAKIPNAANVADIFLDRGADKRTYAIGCTAWYLTLCTNTQAYPEPPKSWKALWDKKNAGKIGLGSLLSDMFLLEMAAATFFGGTKILDTKEGINSVLDKLAEMIPNVKLWWRDEGQFQQALNSGEVPMGEYFNDVTRLAAKNGFPVRSTFPVDGGIVQYGSWVVAKTTAMPAESQAFINFTSDPRIQALITRNVGTAPIVDRSKTDLTDEEFAAVSSDIPPIAPRYDVHLDNGQWINQRWSTMIAD